VKLLRGGSTRLEQQSWPAREIFANGKSRTVVLGWPELRKRVTVTDARLLLRTSALDLAIRDKCVVFDLGLVRGFASRDGAVLLLGHNDAEQIVHAIEVATQSTTINKNDQVKEDPTWLLVFLEAVLEEAYSDAVRRFAKLEAKIRNELPGMTNLNCDETRGQSLYRLLPLETALREDAVRGRRIYALIADALRNEARLSLVANDDNVDILKNEKYVEALESVFENALCRWEFLNDAGEKLSAAIDATRSLAELALDAERNRMERINVYLNIVALGFAFCSVIGGYFGMNLLIGLETKPGVFNFVIFATTLSAILFCLGCARSFESGQRRQASHVDAMLSALGYRPFHPDLSNTPPPLPDVDLTSSHNKQFPSFAAAVKNRTPWPLLRSRMAFRRNQTVQTRLHWIPNTQHPPGLSLAPPLRPDETPVITTTKNSPPPSANT